MKFKQYLKESYSKTNDLSWNNYAPKSWQWTSNKDELLWDKQAGEKMINKFGKQIIPILKKNFDMVHTDGKVHDISSSTSHSSDWRQFMEISIRNESMTEPKIDIFGAPKTKRTGKGLKKFLPGSSKEILKQTAWITLRIYALKDTNSDIKYFIQPQTFQPRMGEKQITFPNWKSPKSVADDLITYAKKR